MPVLEIHIGDVTQVRDSSSLFGSKKYMVYVRLNGQTLRTKALSSKTGLHFNETFRLSFPRRNFLSYSASQLFTEVWSQSNLSTSCVSMAWIDLRESDFVRGQPKKYAVCGNYESRGASVSVTLNPLDFGASPGTADTYTYQRLPAQEQALSPTRPAALGVLLEAPPPYPYSSATYVAPPPASSPAAHPPSLETTQTTAPSVLRESSSTPMSYEQLNLPAPNYPPL